MKVYLIRHARTEDAEMDIHQRDNTPIIFSSVKKDLYKDLKPEKVYTSPLLRARQTAKMLFGDYEVIEYIHEFIRPQQLNGKSHEIGRLFWDKHLAKLRDNPDWKYGGCESFNEIKSRTYKFLKFLESLPYKSVAVVSHGTFFRYLVAVHKFGEDFTFPFYEKEIMNIKWENLECREIEIKQ